jgi:putative FmdB family regulatory protein
MPIYEFQCLNPNCNHKFEEIRKITDKLDLNECPKCSSPAKKIISLSSFKFNCGGFYATDYGNSSINGNGSKKKETGTSSATKSSETVPAQLKP